jgi:riboflavin synthase
MFTGLVEGMAKVAEIIDDPPGKRLILSLGKLAKGVSVGGSVAINGCCLTVVDVDGDRLAFEAGSETLSRTNLGRLDVGSHVNIERSLRLGDELGGHLVTGHIDGVGTLDVRKDEGDWSFFWFRTSRSLMRQMASKGSVAVDGVSLTLVEVEDERFSVALIPHTLDVTTLGQLQRGDEANLETDVLAKYVERQLTWAQRGVTDAGSDPTAANGR